MSFLAPFRPQLLSVLRIMTALLMLQHGLTKVVNWPPSDFNDVPLTTPGGFAGIIELVFGLLLLIGLFSRLAAFILSGTMAVAYFLAHAPQGFFPMLNGGELAVLYCFTLLYLAAAGPGPWSVDGARSR